MTPAGLSRFLTAQERSYPAALAEVRDGRKATHWMWFVFPQLRGLGRSEAARFYGIADLDEARRYLAHPVLGPRLVEVSRAMLGHSGARAADILGETDALKLRSCATLFSAVPGADPVFGQLLDTFHGGEPCPRTLDMLDAE